MGFCRNWIRDARKHVGKGYWLSASAASCVGSRKYHFTIVCLFHCHPGKFQWGKLTAEKMLFCLKQESCWCPKSLFTQKLTIRWSAIAVNMGWTDDSAVILPSKNYCFVRGNMLVIWGSIATLVYSSLPTETLKKVFYQFRLSRSGRHHNPQRPQHSEHAVSSPFPPAVYRDFATVLCIPKKPKAWRMFII